MRKTQRKQSCSNCSLAGHNRLTCPDLKLKREIAEAEEELTCFPPAEEIGSAFYSKIRNTSDPHELMKLMLILKEMAAACKEKLMRCL